MSETPDNGMTFGSIPEQAMLLVTMPKGMESFLMLMTEFCTEHVEMMAEHFRKRYEAGVIPSFPDSQAEAIEDLTLGLTEEIFPWVSAIITYAAKLDQMRAAAERARNAHNN